MIHPVVIVGAGPTGLTLAIDLAQRGVRVVLIDGDARRAKGLPSAGSKAICFAKRTLEVWDKLGVGQRMVDKGVPWNVGRVFLQDDEVYSFNLQSNADDQRPAFINLQQYYAEEF
jgi:3-(3-hydroxy-phenyl)propionate hydroxylase